MEKQILSQNRHATYVLVIAVQKDIVNLSTAFFSVEII
jgi:hypothetical protein